MGKKAEQVAVAIRTELVMPPEAEAPEITMKEAADMTESAHARRRIKGMEDVLLERAMSVVDDAMSFADIPYDQKEFPEEWLLLMTEEQAQRRFRQIKAGQMPSSHAPMGVKVALAVTTGILKARAAKGSAPKLNLQMVILTKPEVREYPVQKHDA